MLWVFVLASSASFAKSQSGWTCQPGQGALSKYTQQSPHNSEIDCGAACLAHSGCQAFDFTTNVKDQACRLYDTSDNARIGTPGGDYRQFCTLSSGTGNCSSFEGVVLGTGVMQSINNVSSPGDCCDLCGDNPACAAYTYQPTDQACLLKDNASPNGEREDRISGAIQRPQDSLPNIVFLVVESTDGRAWTRDYQDGAVDLPNLRALQDKGTEFRSHYSNTPVCCPSRATFWSGRHAHNIPHDQKTSGMFVGGVWNNHEGLPPNFTDRLDQFLTDEGYNVKMSGKFDWTTGAHSENVYLNAWTMYTRFPYNLSLAPGGWTTETDCVDKGSVGKGNTPWLEGGATPWAGDWTTLNSTTTWITEQAAVDSRPFFVYQGMNIVHPSYRTSQYWYDKVDQSKIRIPKWKDLEDMHPCDFQSSMLKGCLPPSDTAGDFYADSHRVHIRTIYLAMVAEFDAMVGAYVQAVKDAGKHDNTVYIVTSDHGDMQMEHRQFYKMAAYDASSRVPMVIMDARRPRQVPLVTKAATQLIDIYPTVLTYAGVPQSKWPALDGQPLQALLADEHQQVAEGRVWPQIQGRPDFVVSQFHGDNIAMSWFLVVHDGFKLVVWGTGEQHPHQLFDLTGDPDEETNLVKDVAHADRMKTLLAKLESVVDFAAVGLNVARYNHDSMKYWTEKTANWQDEMGKTSLRWGKSWNQDAEGSVAAVEAWLAKPPAVEACRSDRAWPAPSRVSFV